MHRSAELNLVIWLDGFKRSRRTSTGFAIPILRQSKAQISTNNIMSDLIVSGSSDKKSKTTTAGSSSTALVIAPPSIARPVIADSLAAGLSAGRESCSLRTGPSGRATETGRGSVPRSPICPHRSRTSLLAKLATVADAFGLEALEDETTFEERNSVNLDDASLAFFATTRVCRRPCSRRRRSALRTAQRCRRCPSAVRPAKESAIGSTYL